MDFLCTAFSVVALYQRLPHSFASFFANDELPSLVFATGSHALYFGFVLCPYISTKPNFHILCRLTLNMAYTHLDSMYNSASDSGSPTAVSQPARACLRLALDRPSSSSTHAIPAQSVRRRTPYPYSLSSAFAAGALLPCSRRICCPSDRCRLVCRPSCRLDGGLDGELGGGGSVNRPMYCI